MSIRYRARLCLGVSALAVMVAGNAFAQMEAAPDVQEDVLVTGSLLGNANFVAPSPVTQITTLDVQARSLTSIGTLVSELPFATPGGGLVQNTFGVVQAGQSQNNLRNLGANRTLTLIDGQRPTPVDAENDFDSNLIPAALVDRFDVVTTGASASYGSDAVAGVVNFVLKDRMEGFSSNFQYGTSQHNDTKQLLGSIAWGTEFAGGRGHFIIGGEAAKQYDTVFAYSRDWGRREENLVALTGTRPAGTPANIWSNNAEYNAGTPGGLITGCNGVTTCAGGLKGISFDEDGNAYPYPYGTLNGGTYSVTRGNYGNSDLNRPLNPPYFRAAALARVGYDITPNTNVFLTVNYGQLEDYGPSQGTPFPITFQVASGNPFIPAPIQALMTQNGINTITLSKETLNIPGAHADNKNTTIQAFYGIRGAFGDWDWDVQGNAGRSEIWQVFANVPVNENLYRASHVVTGPSGPECGPDVTNPNTIPNVPPYAGCVPFNPFGLQATDESLNYILNPPNGNAGSHANARQYMVQADVRGPLFDLPSGPLSIAAGTNWRRNSFSQDASQAAKDGVFAARNNPSFSNDQTTYEFYGEVGVPLLRDLPLIKALDLSAAARYTHYSISGPVWTWKYGATWDITDWVRLRGTLSTDIRAPNFTETANVPSSGSAQITNPLSNVRQFLPGILTNGNPNLKPEIAHSASAGIVFTPDWSFLKGFRASVDYFRVNLTGVIASVSAQDIVIRCLGQPGISPAIPSYCSQIQFSGSDIQNTFGITTITQSQFNLNSRLVDGFDINLRDDLPLGDWFGLPGVWTISALGTYTNQNRTNQTLTTGAIQSVDATDTGPVPRWAANTTLTFTLDRISTSLQYRYYSPIKYSTTLVGPDEPTYSPTASNSISQNVFSAAERLNFRISYDAIQGDNGENLQFYLNIDNILDKDPPPIWWYVQNYDVVGRYFKFGVRYTMP